MKLNPKQLSYIKGLDSKKKQRKFLLDCILENVIGESKEIKVEKVTDEKLTGTGYENAFFKVRIPIGADFSDVLECYSRKVYEKGKFATIIPQENNELVNLTDEIKNIEVDFENVSQKENN
jgi:hypothetical protein